MDQEAFRQLVSTSSAVAGPSSNRAFGKAHRRTQPNPSSAASSTKPSDLQPRKSKPNDGYVDRAAARRSGNTDAEFRDIEALYADFEDRIAAATTEEERQTLRDQISSVGGDARYSVLVKGLDWALLAQNKAKIARETGGDAGDGAGEGEGDDLEAAYQESKDKGSARDEANETGGKRSREEIVEAIKRRRQGKNPAAAEENAKGGFRPIGFKPIGAADKQDDSAEYKWVNGKRMRKKKKHAEPTDAPKILEDPAAAAKQSGGASTRPQSRVTSSLPAERKASAELQSQQPPRTSFDDAERAVASTPKESSTQKKTSSPSTTTSDGDAETSTARPAAPTTAATLAPPAPAPQKEEAESEDEDIFADVGGWDGIPDTKDDEADSDAAPAELPRRSPAPVSILSQTEAAQAEALPVDAADDPPPAASAPTPPAQDDSGPLDPPTVPAAAEVEVPAEPSVPTPGVEVPAEAPVPTPVEPSSQPARPKKSKWDDADDVRDKKKKKHKKKH